MVNVLGLMSGTSLDGLDMAYCGFEQNSFGWSFEIKNTKTIPYNKTWYKKLSQAGDLSGEELARLDISYGNWVGSKIRSFIRKHTLKPDLISSHGHTVFHQPQHRLTYQLGHGLAIHTVCHIPVVSDFRSQDVLLGGQGAPLVPLGDALLFSDFDFCLNLGGIGNISYDLYGKRIAFDVCPVNMVLNHLSRQLGFDFDKGGKIARSGRPIPDLLKRLNALTFYEQKFPKSLSFEWVNEYVYPILEAEKESISNLLCTFIEHISIQINKSISHHLFFDQQARLLITGGGALNDYFIERLQSHLPLQVKVHIPDMDLIQYKEALIFGLLGLLRSKNKINCLASVTGASMDHSSGQIFNCFGME